MANLEIDGIDFAADVLRIRQRKERQAVVFPMTRRLRSALKVYLRDGRPACSSAAVFVRHHAPLGKPLTSVGICHVVLRLADEAGLRDRVRGAHMLRRSLASRMLNAGATLKQIADFWGTRRSTPRRYMPKSISPRFLAWRCLGLRERRCAHETSDNGTPRRGLSAAASGTWFSDAIPRGNASAVCQSILIVRDIEAR